MHLSSVPKTKPSQSDLERIYRSLRLIRRAEEEVARIYPSDKIKSPVHLSIGQEAVAVGVCDVLASGRCGLADLSRTRRLSGQGRVVARHVCGTLWQGDRDAHGKGGSMHLIDMQHNVLGACAVVGTTIPVALGFALAFKRTQSNRVVVAFFGDGATEEGVFTESLNFAALHKLPILFVCENNFYAIHTPVTRRWATQRLCERVETYGIPARCIEDGDVLKLRAETSAAVAGLRRGDGPAFIECRTYRWLEHVGPNEDFDAGYRASAEREPWVQSDQLIKIGALIADERRSAIDEEVEAEIADAIAFAEASPFPDISALYTNVFAGE